jgi:tetratricopeptide (TPR) repeat protein
VDSSAPREVGSLDPARSKELRTKALQLLERGKYKESIVLAEQAVDADPTDAYPYLYWGTALMETGKRAEAKAVFTRCLETAKKGPINECRQFR